MQEHEAGFDSPARCAFRLYLRMGQRAAAGSAVEVKFNPYHDPRNGRFTFAPGGPRSLRDVIVSPRGYLPAPPGGAGGRGSNIRAFNDPMTLQQVFPNTGGAAARALIAPVEGFFNLKGPANELITALVVKHGQAITAQIREIDPKYHPRDWLPTTFQGQMNYLNGLRLDRAAAFYRIRGDPRPLQVETLRFLQRKVDEAYAHGLKLLKAGRLSVRLSEQEALGNFIDRTVRQDLRRMYNQYGIVSHPARPVRVVGREYQSGGADRTYRVPDSRVADVAYDATLTLKTLATPQVRGFFASDFQPRLVVIVRPSQLGPNSTYAIPRPRN